MSSLREDLIIRFDRLKSVKDVFNQDLQDISTYIYPNGSVMPEVDKSEVSESTRRQSIADNIGERAVEDLAGFIVSTLAPPGRKWLLLFPENPKLMEKPRVSAYLTKASRIIEKYLFKPEVAFHLAFDESALEACALGNGVPYLQERRDKKGNKQLYFRSIPFNECYFQENTWGKIDVGFRLRKMTAKQIFEEYIDIEDPSHDMDLNDIERMKAFAEREPNKSFDLIYGSIPKGDPLYRKAGVDGEYLSVHVFRDGANNTSGILRKGITDFFPFRPYRFRKRPGQTYGYGPGHRAISDIITLQRMKKTNITAAELTVRPPLHIPYGTYAKRLSLKAGAANHAKRTGTNKDNKAEPLFVVGSVPIGVEMEDRVKAAIREAFYLDDLKESKVGEMSATETSVRREERMTLMSPQLSRIASELLNELIEIVYDFLIEQGMLEDPPSELKGMGISPVYISEILKSQSDTDLISLERLSSTMLSLSQAFPELKDMINQRSIPKFLVEKLFLSHDFLRDEQEVQEEQVQKQQMNAFQGQAQAAESASKANLNLAKTAEALGI